VENELDDLEIEDIVYPQRAGRSWDNPEYRAEWDAYVAARKAKIKEVVQGYEHLEQEGGGEGGGEHCYGVFKLRGKIYLAEYSYYSHNGHEYDCIASTLKEVAPVQKTITVYE
jgi:hypothetical protein